MKKRFRPSTPISNASRARLVRLCRLLELSIALRQWEAVEERKLLNEEFAALGYPNR